jgi:hypothetical protein
MRLLCAALILLSAASAASADIRVAAFRSEGGKLIIAGETHPGRTVTLDNKYKSDGEGHFRFSVMYKPPTCMSDLRAGEDVYSAVIAGCFGVTSDAAPMMKPKKSAQ